MKVSINANPIKYKSLLIHERLRTTRIFYTAKYRGTLVLESTGNLLSGRFRDTGVRYFICEYDFENRIPTSECVEVSLEKFRDILENGDILD